MHDSPGERIAGAVVAGGSWNDVCRVVADEGVGAAVDCVDSAGTFF